MLNSFKKLAVPTEALCEGWGEAITWKSFLGAILLTLGTFFIAS